MTANPRGPQYEALYALLAEIAAALWLGATLAEVQPLRDTLQALVLTGDASQNVVDLRAAADVQGLDLSDPRLGVPEVEPGPGTGPGAPAPAPVPPLPPGDEPPAREIPVPPVGPIEPKPQPWGWQHFLDAPGLARFAISHVFPYEMWGVFAAMGACESLWRLEAWNQLREDSRGWWQINVGPGANTDLIDLVGPRDVNGIFDPFGNALAAATIWQRQGVARAWVNCAASQGVPAGISGRGPVDHIAPSLAALNSTAATLGIANPYVYPGDEPPPDDDAPGVTISLPGPLPDINLSPLFDGLTSALGGLVGNLRDTLAAILAPIDAALDALRAGIAALTQELIPTLAESLAATVSGIDDLMGLVGALAQQGVDLPRELLDSLAAGLGEVSGAIFGLAQAAITAAMDGATDKLDAARLVEQSPYPGFAVDGEA